MIFSALSNATYRVSLRGQGAEIEAPQQVAENLEAQQGAG